MMRIAEKLANESNREYALRVIRENLVFLGLEPGIMISEQDIAEELHLSRTPVHEALQELARTKIIEVFPQKGSRVSLIDMKLVNESMFMRKIIEEAVVMEACDKASEADIKFLEENVMLQAVYQSSKNLDKLLELDNIFHKRMYEIADRMQCYQAVHEMSIHFDRVRELSLHSGNIGSVIDEHKQILKYFAAKDKENLRKMQIAHLERISLDEHGIREQYSKYFKN